MNLLEMRPIVMVAGAALCILTLPSVAQTTLGKPGGGGTTTQDVNVVNTPTVNIGSGGPIGVDVLSLPTQPLPTTAVEKPQYILSSIEVPAFAGRGTFTYTPNAGTRTVIKSVMIGPTSDFTQLELHFYDKVFLLSKTGSVLETTISLPSGPFSIVYNVSGVGAPRLIPVLVTFYEVPATW